MRWQLWPDPTTSIYFDGLENVEIQVIGTPSVAYTPQRSGDGSTFVAANAYDKDGNTVTSITVAGFYNLIGGCHIKLAGGSGSTIYVRAGA